MKVQTDITGARWGDFETIAGDTLRMRLDAISAIGPLRENGHRVSRDRAELVLAGSTKCIAVNMSPDEVKRLYFGVADASC